MIIFRVIGHLLAISLLLCISLVVKKHLSLKNADQYEGIVVGYEERKSLRGKGGHRHNVFALKVDYLREDYLQVHKFTTLVASYPPSKEIGEKVKVFVYKDGKEEALDFQFVYIFYWIWFCVGFLAAGLVWLPKIFQLIYINGA